MAWAKKGVILDALTIVLLVAALVMSAFIYSRTRSGFVSIVGPVGLLFIIGGVWNLAAGKESAWGQIGIGVVGVLLMLGAIGRTAGRRG